MMERKKNPLFQSNRIYQIPIDQIVPNPGQPRRHFEEQAMRELAESVRQHGVIQPLSVQKNGSGYVLVAGERRLRAAGMAGLTRVPCILVKASPRESAVLALVENLQRCDLHYMDEAAAIARLISSYGMSQEEAARALLRLEGEEAQLAALRHIGERGLNVAASEEYIDVLLQKRPREDPPRRPVYVIKDVRLFLNSVNRGMETIRRAGVNARYDKQESEEEITITIQIPKRKAAAG